MVAEPQLFVAAERDEEIERGIENENEKGDYERAVMIDHSRYDMRRVGELTRATEDVAELVRGSSVAAAAAVEFGVMHEEGLNSEMKFLVDTDSARIGAEVAAS